MLLLVVIIAICCDYCCCHYCLSFECTVVIIMTEILRQVDLIDMRHRPDGSYQWIAHYMDHWAKFHCLFPLMRKSAAEVALGLQKYVFAFLGTPKILHSDNGREFINDVIRNLLDSWPGETTIISGRPRHPQSQGLVEQGNACVERLLGARILQHEGEDSPWTEWLPLVQCKSTWILIVGFAIVKSGH